jgi:transcriptional regulator with XRE-family HTH domain
MDNLVISLKSRCKTAGITLKELCERAGVTTATIRNWQKEEPKTVRLMRQLQQTMAQIEKERETAC